MRGAILGNYCLSDLRNKDAFVGHVFSLPSAALGAQHGRVRFTGMGEALITKFTGVAPALEHGDADDLQVDGPQAPAPQAGAGVFFNIVKADPSKQKVARMAPGAGRKLISSDIAVALVGARELDGGVHNIDTEPLRNCMGGTQAAVLSGLTHNFDDVRAMKHWSRGICGTPCITTRNPRSPLLSLTW